MFRGFIVEPEEQILALRHELNHARFLAEIAPVFFGERAAGHKI